jgi:hypothetical protein
MLYILKPRLSLFCRSWQKNMSLKLDLFVLQKPVFHAKIRRERRRVLGMPGGLLHVLDRLDLQGLQLARQRFEV